MLVGRNSAKLNLVGRGLKCKFGLGFRVRVMRMSSWIACVLASPNKKFCNQKVSNTDLKSSPRVIER